MVTQHSDEQQPLLQESPTTQDPEAGGIHGYGDNNTIINNDQEQKDDEEEEHFHFVPIKERGWSFQEGRRSLMAQGTTAPSHLHHHPQSTSTTKTSSSPIAADTATASATATHASHNDGGETPKTKICGHDQNSASASSSSNLGSLVSHSLYCAVYALVNIVISAPGLYGYAAVIFNHPIFANHMNALSKLVLFSSLIHQLGFTLFSTLDFAIGTVQDAGLIFLSGMANTIANRMIEDGHTEMEIVSTTLVLLSIGTATLGLVLVLMGHFRLADAVSYLPMPVVGGYLAFIGFFCIQAGLALCISKSITTLSEWTYIWQDTQHLMLALPGLGAGLILTMVSRKIQNSGALPLVMVLIPALFYFLLWVCGSTLDDAREMGWVGPVAPAVPVTDLFTLVNFHTIRWDLWIDVLPTWVGMVFVVSFASCLDVAAISIDMGTALNTNKELSTVGVCNIMSGLTFGFTGSYIFSQTIFTYRTGVHSRLIGILVMAVFLYIVVSPVNMLQISPLFFLGSTLIFIGYDLMFEWLWEVRENVFLSEYVIVWLTFLAIQVVGIDAGIVLGVLIAIVEQIVTTAQSSSVVKVDRRSRAVWTPSDAKLLHDYAYSSIGGARIITLEMHGTVFFGSALSMLNSISDDISLHSIAVDDGNHNNNDGSAGSVRATPHTSKSALTLDRKPSTLSSTFKKGTNPEHTAPTRPPKYLILDLSHMTHLDASATRGTFLQLINLCSKHGIVVCASGCTPRVEWMFRSHGVSIDNPDDESIAKARLLSSSSNSNGNSGTRSNPTLLTSNNSASSSADKILLFMTVQESLEFCETLLLHRLHQNNRPSSLSLLDGPEERSLGDVIAHMLGSDEKEMEILERLDSTLYHDEVTVKSGEYLFQRQTYPDSFFVVLSGVVANSTSTERLRSRHGRPVVSGAGLVTPRRVGSASNLLDDTYKANNPNGNVATLWQVGGVFGYNDFLLDKPRTYGALATIDGTKVAKIYHSHINLASSEDPEVYQVLQKVLLHASTMDLANCTCHDV